MHCKVLAFQVAHCAKGGCLLQCLVVSNQYKYNDLIQKKSAASRIAQLKMEDPLELPNHQLKEADKQYKNNQLY